MTIFFIYLLLTKGVCGTAQDTTEKKIHSSKGTLTVRVAPLWFDNAKLGIFVHWGLYSVPAWATPTTTPDKVNRKRYNH